jgi:hypothetical protein
VMQKENVSYGVKKVNTIMWKKDLLNVLC